MSSPAELSASELPMDSTLMGPVLIIGSGLLGASIGLGLRAAGCEDVYVQDISPTAEAVALQASPPCRSRSAPPSPRSWWWWLRLRIVPVPCALAR